MYPSAGPWGVARMAQKHKPSQAERELLAYADELGILRQAQHLAEIAGCARATQALQAALLDIAHKEADGSLIGRSLPSKKNGSP
jgi:hypothetical protein